MKKEQMTLLIGVVLCATLSLALFLMGIDIYNISSVAIGELLATVLIMKALTRQESEKTFLVSGVMTVSFFFVLILLGIAIVLPIASLYMVLVYGIAIIIYIALFYFARHMSKSNSGIDKNITELQQCLELIQTIISSTKDKKIIERFQKIEEDLKQLDMSRDYDLMKVAFQLMQYMKNSESSEMERINIKDIEMLVFQYTAVSKQAKYGKAI